jgi:hypothetical protein
MGGPPHCLSLLDDVEIHFLERLDKGVPRNLRASSTVHDLPAHIPRFLMSTPFCEDFVLKEIQGCICVANMPHHSRSAHETHRLFEWSVDSYLLRPAHGLQFPGSHFTVAPSLELHRRSAAIRWRHMAFAGRLN